MEFHSRRHHFGSARIILDRRSAATSRVRSHDSLKAIFSGIRITWSLAVASDEMQDPVAEPRWLAAVTLE